VAEAAAGVHFVAEAAVYMEVSADVADLGMGAVSVVGMGSTTDEGMDSVGADTVTDTDMADMAAR